ncbi:MAG: HAD family hydrolase [Gemmataceae bacterium]|nr:HAD family hydrolase [Gemmataceae bacterium]
MRRIAFDLDETLGTPLIDGGAFAGWQMRPGAAELLARLGERFRLVLWSVSPRRYLDKALSFGLARWFAESYSWDEVQGGWKDVRRLRVDLLVDDMPHHRQAGEEAGLGACYVVVPAYGSPEDAADPSAWVRLVEAACRQ